MGGSKELVGDINPYLLPIPRPYIVWKSQKQAQIDYKMELDEIEYHISQYEKQRIICPPVTQDIFTKLDHTPSPMRKYEIIKRTFEQYLECEIGIVPIKSIRLFNWHIDRLRVMYERLSILEWMYPEGCIPLV